jgi:hypothetical protein
MSYALEGQQRWDAAERSYLAVLADRRRADQGSPSFTTQRTIASLTRLYAKQQRWPEAARSLAELLQVQRPDPRRESDALVKSLTAALDATAEPAEGAGRLAECSEVLKPIL